MTSWGLGPDICFLFIKIFLNRNHTFWYISINYENIVFNEGFWADLIVEKKVMVELKEGL